MKTNVDCYSINPNVNILFGCVGRMKNIIKNTYDNDPTSL